MTPTKLSSAKRPRRRAGRTYGTWCFCDCERAPALSTPPRGVQCICHTLRSAGAQYSQDVRLAPGQPVLQPGMTELIRCTDLPDDAQAVRLLQEGQKTPWELAFGGKPCVDQ